MSISIIKADNRRLLKKFVSFPKTLYKECENWVPAIDRDEYATFDRKKNGAFEFCDADCFLAFRGDEVVGRVAAILNRKANEIWNTRTVRFGWLDFIEDIEVLTALIDTVEQWGKERGCTDIRGPWGFTDFDREGLLVEGFENLSSFTCIYNFPYYDTLLRQIDFKKDVDWLQEVADPSCYPEIYRLADAVEKRTGTHVVNSGSPRTLSKRYGMEIFQMINRSFAKLSGFSPFSDKQIKTLLNSYKPVFDARFTAICVNHNDKPIGFVLSVPSLAKAIKKSNGKLFPFGIFRILHALKKNETLEWLVFGVDPSHSGEGITLLLLKHIHDNALKYGITRIIFNPHLESNTKAGSLLEHFKTEPYTRRRCYVRECR